MGDDGDGAWSDLLPSGGDRIQCSDTLRLARRPARDRDNGRPAVGECDTAEGTVRTGWTGCCFFGCGVVVVVVEVLVLEGVRTPIPAAPGA
jgi:hypothetical protein